MHPQYGVGSEICQTIPVPLHSFFRVQVLGDSGWPWPRQPYLPRYLVESLSVRLPVSCDDDSFPNFALSCARALIDGMDGVDGDLVMRLMG